MKVLFFIDSFDSGGAQRQIITLSMLLKYENYDVSFLVYGRGDFFRKELDENDIYVHCCESENFISRIIQTRRYIRNGTFDAVISFLDVPNFLNNLASIRGGIRHKVITSERSSNEKLFRTYRGIIFGWFQRYSHSIVCNSYNSLRMWERYYPSYRNKLCVIYNPILLPTVTSQYIPKKNGKIHILVAASYQFLKNSIGLIKAISLLSNDKRDKIVVNWYGRKEVVRGDTKAFDESIYLINELGLKETIYLNGPTKDITNKMYEADIVALFSELEGLPNAICEGMMLGKPIIMSRVSDYSRLVDESNGFLCDWDDPYSIRDAFVKAIELSDKQLVEMGGKSKSKAKQLFSNLQIVNQWKNLLIK